MGRWVVNFRSRLLYPLLNYHGTQEEEAGWDLSRSVRLTARNVAPEPTVLSAALRRAAPSPGSRYLLTYLLTYSIVQSPS